MKQFIGEWLEKWQEDYMVGMGVILFFVCIILGFFLFPGNAIGISFGDLSFLFICGILCFLTRKRDEMTNKETSR